MGLEGPDGEGRLGGGGDGAGAGVAESGLDHTEVLGLTVRILASPLSQLGVEAGESRAEESQKRMRLHF